MMSICYLHITHCYTYLLRVIYDADMICIYSQLFQIYSVFINTMKWNIACVFINTMFHVESTGTLKRVILLRGCIHEDPSMGRVSPYIGGVR